MKKIGFVFLLSALTACGGNEVKPEIQVPEPIVKAATHEEGKKMFLGQCASCHMVNKELTGPALSGVESRWPDKAKLYAFIRNSEEVIKNDEYARELWLKFNKTAMNQHPDLTDEQIDQILSYINSVSESANP